jgi:hypothetical protein
MGRWRIVPPGLALVALSGLMGCLQETRGEKAAALTPGDYSIAALAANPDVPATLVPVAAVKIPAGGEVDLTIRITKLNGFLGDIALSATGLPASVTATFTPPVVPGQTASTAVLALKATTSAPSTPVTVTIVGAYGTAVTRTCALSVGGATPLFTVTAEPVQPFNSTAGDLMSSGSVTIAKSSSVPQTVVATVDALGGFTGPVIYSPKGDPALIVSPGQVGGTLSAKFPETMPTYTITAPAAAPDGDYRPTFTVTSGTDQRTSPVHVVVSDAMGTAWVSDAITLAPGGTASLPVPVRRYPGTAVAPGLNSANVPTGLTVTPSVQWNAMEGIVTVRAASTMPLGDTSFTLTAGIGSGSVSIPVTVHVVDPSQVPADVRVSRVLFGQSILKEKLRLVAGKRALLAVQALADRSGVAATAVTVKALDYVGTPTLALAGPATFPTSESLANLNQFFSVMLPAEWVTPGARFQVAIVSPAGETVIANNTATVTPEVGPSVTMPLTLVPVTANALTGTAPAVADVQDFLTAVWPMGGVRVKVRAPYVFGGTLGSDGTNWDALLAELDGLRTLDGSLDNYYGLVNVSYASGTVGMGYFGGPVAAGWDARNLGPLGVSSLDAVEVMAHELGHEMGRAHAPCGTGAGTIDLTYPYRNGASAVAGFDVRAINLNLPSLAVVQPSAADLMTYCDPRWVSDFTYEKVQDFLETSASKYADALTLTGGATVSGLTVSGGTSMSLVAGSVTADGITLLPIHQATVYGQPSGAGDHTLTIVHAGGVTTVPVTLRILSDTVGGKDIRHFSALVPALEGVTSVTLSRNGATVAKTAAAKRVPSEMAVAQRVVGSAWTAAIPVTLTWADGVAEVRWDNATWPYLMLAKHGQGIRSTLAMSLQGGVARIAITDKADIAWLEASLSDGKTSVAHRLTLK